MASYAYAAGVIRSLEAKILDKNDIERMVNAPDLESAYKVFSDTDYADNLEDVNPLEYKKALNDDFKQAVTLLTDLIDNNKLLDFLFLKNDFRNIKLLFKDKYSEESLISSLKNFGTENAKELKKLIIDEDNNANISERFKEIIAKANENIDKEEKNLSYKIDTYFDEIYFKMMRKIVDSLNNKFIKDLFRIQHKTNNLKFFIRAKRLGKTLKDVEDLLPKKYISVYEQTVEEVLRATYWPTEMQKAIDEYLDDKNLWKLEKNLEEAEINFIRKAKFIAYGPEVVVAYYFAKRNAIRNTRLIITGKMNNVPVEKIKERVREIY